MLSVIILLVISQGNVVVARVRDFTWQHQLIQEKDISLTNSDLDADKCAKERIACSIPISSGVSGRHVCFT